jgi:hypothetical protein
MSVSASRLVASIEYSTETCDASCVGSQDTKGAFPLKARESMSSARSDLIALANGRNADRFLLDNGCDMRVRIFRSIPPSFQSQACAVSRRPAHFTCEFKFQCNEIP